MGRVMDELEFVMRERDHLAEVAYRLAQRCEVLEEAHNEAVWALWSRNAGPGESLEEWVAQGMADAEAEVAERWPR